MERMSVPGCPVEHMFDRPSKCGSFLFSDFLKLQEMDDLCILIAIAGF
jgi:hypothetical protein